MTTSNKKAEKKVLKKNLLRFAVSFILVIVLTICCFQIKIYAESGINIGINSDSGGTLGTLEIMFMLMLIALAPSILIMMTSFTRIIIVLSFLRNALGTQQSPPNQVLVGLALFLSLFIMMPVLKQIDTEAYKPFRAGTITQEQAIEKAVKPMKVFMLKQTNTKDLNLFLSMAKTQTIEEKNSKDETKQSKEQRLEKLTELGLEIIVPSFITSELKRAFLIGFLLFIPFLIIDIVVSSTLMSMGMVMLPPSMIALPFKLMIFVLVDGWDLLLGTLVKGFYQ